MTERDAKRMQVAGPVVFAQIKHSQGVSDIAGHILLEKKSLAVG